ncbi:MAG: response regulator [Hyphomonadaceae bacterium]
MYLMRALVVERSIEQRANWVGALQGMGFECLCADDGIEALQLASTQGVDVVVMDIETSRIGGADLVHLIASGLFGDRPPPTIVSVRDDQCFKPGRTGSFLKVVTKANASTNLTDIVDRAMGLIEDLQQRQSA